MQTTKVWTDNGVAGLQEGIHTIGIECEAPYIDIATARMTYTAEQA